MSPAISTGPDDCQCSIVISCWQFWLYTDQLIEDGETTWVLNWPVSPWWRVVTILIIICVPVTLVTVIQYFKNAFQKQDASDASGSPAEQPEEGKP